MSWDWPKTRACSRWPSELLQQAAAGYAQSQDKQRLFGWLDYAAGTWDRSRRVIAKAEHSDQGANPRFVVTSLHGEAQAIYDEVYCARGEMENRIKEQQLGLFADRTSCHGARPSASLPIPLRLHGWWANQLRLLLSSAAYVLLETIRRIGLRGTKLDKAQAATIRLKLLKIGTVIVRNTRRIRLLFSSASSLRQPAAPGARPPQLRLRPRGAGPGTKKNNGGWGHCLHSHGKTALAGFAPSDRRLREQLKPKT